MDDVTRLFTRLQGSPSERAAPEEEGELGCSLNITPVADDCFVCGAAMEAKPKTDKERRREAARREGAMTRAVMHPATWNQLHNVLNPRGAAVRRGPPWRSRGPHPHPRPRKDLPHRRPAAACASQS